MEEKISTIELSPLDAAETAKLASEVQGYALEDRDTIRLFRATEGNPLFVVETVRASVAGSVAIETNTTKTATSDDAITSTSCTADIRTSGPTFVPNECSRARRCDWTLIPFDC
jgi:predicted ATPase